jgi:hypothetical protein
MRQAAAAASGSLPSASVSDRDRLRSSSVELASVEEWDAWLAENHEESDDVWLRIAKMKAEVETVRYPAVLDVALSWGWIDGQRLPLDETYFLQRFVRRRPRSRWSQVNCDKAERLIAAGRMHPPGLAEVDRAKSDGRWDAAYAPQSRAQCPPIYGKSSTGVQRQRPSSRPSRARTDTRSSTDSRTPSARRRGRGA